MWVCNGGRVVSLLALVSFCSACSTSSLVRYQPDPSDYRYPHGKERALGTLHLNGTPEAPREQIHLYKIHKGYALRGYLDETPEKATALRVSRDKDYRWFGGIEWRWNF